MLALFLSLWQGACLSSALGHVHGAVIASIAVLGPGATYRVACANAERVFFLHEAYILS